MTSLRAHAGRRNIRQRPPQEEDVARLWRSEAATADYARAQTQISEVLLSGSRQLDLSHLTSLVELPASIGRCDTLQTLNLANTLVQDLRVLAPLIQLEKLVIYGCPVADVTPLWDMKALRHLNVSGTLITSIAALEQLNQIELLDLSHTRISDIAALAPLNSLRELILRDTDVAEIAVLRQAVNLRILDVSFTPAAETVTELGLRADMIIIH
ncbi:hypothetical protein OE810_08995 [Rhodobacteraceae bacterium XHP0102]|nr:hypothetical protein [Rhodobacteraceae bacterium XHP0102]